MSVITLRVNRTDLEELLKACEEHKHFGECECDRTAGWALLAAIHDN